MQGVLRRGSPLRLGATYDGAGVNFAVFSSVAERIELHLFAGSEDREPTAVYELPQAEDDASIFCGYVSGVEPGQLYGLRVHGPYDPRRGHRCNASKLLVDPYARAIAGRLDWSGPIHGERAEPSDQHPVADRRDDAGAVPKAVVVDEDYDWQGDRRPATPWSESVIYEAHVKGMTMTHPQVPQELRGTYAGLAHPAIIDHLVDLGVTAVQLLPVFEILDEAHLARRSLTNYWGYSTLGYFAPAARYFAPGRAFGKVDEFKDMVRALHRAGLEVILDVVFNHTGEGSDQGPTLSLRGLDNAAYYRLMPGDRRHYVDTSGCGNALNLGHPQTLRLVMDSLRYWVEQMHVDGFRFDLAPTLARDHGGFDPGSRFFAAIHQDPTLRGVKLIAEPWDLGSDGYRLGGFPAGWGELNGRFRDCVRRFWRGDAGLLGELGSRLTGSSDLFAAGGRRPQASVNFVTCHDGFTLRDLVSYSHKHNHANGEENRDGSDHEHSSNHGAEGPTDVLAIDELRARQTRNLAATLLLSQGVPMLLAGDELGRSQGGNNNAYCQDNETSWIDWAGPESEAIHAWIRRLLALRRRFPQLRRRRFFRGEETGPGRAIQWLRPDGAAMERACWGDPDNRTLALWLAAMGDAGEGLMILINASAEAVDVSLAPQTQTGERWRVLADSRSAAIEESWLAEGQRTYRALGRSLVLFAVCSEPSVDEETGR